MTDKANRILSILSERFKIKGAANFDLQNELNFTDPVTETSLNEEEKEFVRKELQNLYQYKESHDGAVLIPVSIVSDPRQHEEWYDEWLSENNTLTDSYYWKRLENFLSHELSSKYTPENAGRIVRSIDEATLAIMKKVAAPARREFSYKGLVVGYVQSGKTANFTALIAKAADAGYKFVIVLSGIHSVLRRQTQIRLDKELTGMNDLGIEQSFIAEPSDIKRWNRITTGRLKKAKRKTGQIKISDLGEFNTVNIDPFDSICNRATPTIAIIKKNVRVLDKLIEYISQSSEQNRNKIPLLVIDDEADQASIDGNANSSDSDPTSINDRIRKILSYFRRKIYIGYTATPFANVLIDMDTEHEDLGYDLYPRNFIVSLPEPEGYFGTSRIFQGDLGSKFVTPISDIEDDITRNGITDSLSQAIDQFLLSCAVRNIRGDGNKPMSMLVHISNRTAIHSMLHGMITGYINTIKGRYTSSTYSASLKKQLKKTWELFIKSSTEINRILKKDNLIPGFEDIWNELSEIFKVLTILELNSASEDILDYTTGEKIKVIAIGGNQLSRGLTLEGLMTSYYLRASGQYDTLLQMGRWFGYRNGYEDLTRIFTTKDILDYFSHLSVVEEELRLDIKRYDEPDCTPADLALTIRTHSRLAVTSANKLGAAKLRQASYSDSFHQTFRFPLDQPDKILANLNLGKSFITKCETSSDFKESWVKGVFVSKESFTSEFIITNFINKYHFEERYNGPGLEPQLLKEYILRRSNDNELRNWKIALAGNTQKNNFAGLGNVPSNKINRSRMANAPGFDCGVITDKKHLLADLKKGAESKSDGRTSDQALLIIYVIDKNSKGELPKRVDLYANIDSEKNDVLGFAIVLPESNNEPFNRIGQ